MRQNRYRLHELPGYVLLLIAPPIALIWLLGSPLPDHPPTQAQWQAWLREPPTWPVITATITVAIWLIWAGYAATVGLELYRWAKRRRRLPRLSIPRPMQAISAAVLGATAVSAHAAAANAATAPVDTTASQPDKPPATDRVLAAHTTTAQPAQPPSPPAAAAAGSPTQAAAYVVKRGTT